MKTHGDRPRGALEVGHTSWIALLLLLIAMGTALRGQEPAAAPSVKDLIAQLGGSDEDEVLEQLKSLELKISLPSVLACLSEGEPSEAFSAARVLGIVCHDAKRSDPTIRGAVRRLRALIAKGQSKTRRVVAVHALGALGPHAKPAVADLAKIVNGREQVGVRTAAAVTLGRIGKDALGVLKKNLSSKLLNRNPYLTTTLSLAAIGTLNEEGKGARKALARIVTDEDSFRATLLCRAARNAMVMTNGRKLADSHWSTRVKLEQGRVWRGKGGVNLGGFVPNEPNACIALLMRDLKIELEGPVAAMSLPSAFDPGLNGQYFALVDAIRQLLGHLVSDLAATAKKMSAGEVKTWEAWLAAARGGDLLASFLHQLLDRKSAPGR